MKSQLAEEAEGVIDRRMQFGDEGRLRDMTAHHEMQEESMEAARGGVLLLPVSAREVMTRSRKASLRAVPSDCPAFVPAQAR